MKSAQDKIRETVKEVFDRGVTQGLDVTPIDFEDKAIDHALSQIQVILDEGYVDREKHERVNRTYNRLLADLRSKIPSVEEIRRLVDDIKRPHKGIFEIGNKSALFVELHTFVEAIHQLYEERMDYVKAEEI